MVHSHLYLIRSNDDEHWDDNILGINYDEDDDYIDHETFIDEDVKELEIKLIKIIENCVSLVNNKGYFLLGFYNDGLLCESDIRTTVYDLNNDLSWKIIGVDVIG